MQYDFPYYKYITNDTEIIKIFNKLKNQKIILSHDKYKVAYVNINPTYNNKYISILFNDELYEYYYLSDYFNEHCRIKCKMINSNGTPEEFYNKNKKIILDEMYKWRDTINIETIRIVTKGLLVKNNYNICSYFNPLIIKYFIDLFDAKKILDMSSGWGDRLIGTLASNAEEYHGFDPNNCLHEGYNNIIKLLNKKNIKIKIEELPFQDALLKDNYYDLMMSSPPYFDIEEYVINSQQSIYNKNEKKWYDDFLLISINKIIKALTINGHLCLNIFQKQNHKYITWLLNDMTKNKNIKFLGIISINKSVKYNFHEPIFIWKKIK